MITEKIFSASIGRFLSPIADLFANPEVNEIMINGPFEIWAEKNGLLELTNYTFETRDALNAALNNISQFSGRPIGDDNPILEAHLPDGSRIEAVMPPLADNGPIVAIRRFKHSDLTLRKLLEYKSISKEAARYLRQCVIKKKNIVIAGGTGTGKTSLLGVLSSLIPNGERIVVIEDTREIQIQRDHVVYLETRSADERGRGLVTIRNLLRATLRLRPDRIIVGEVRGAEAVDLIQSMTSGHGGSLTTAHATTPADTLNRLETMALMDDLGLPLFALRSQVSSAIDIIVQVERTREGKRQIKSISRVTGLSSDNKYVIRNTFTRPGNGELVRVKKKEK